MFSFFAEKMNIVFRKEFIAMSKFWLEEAPIIAKSDKNVVRYYRNARMLNVSKPDWTTKDGKELPGKTITLNIGAFKEKDPHELINILNDVIDILRGKE